jgi:hypothetical protein
MMSDYLGNLIARTVSPAVAVRPHLPSIFEPAPPTRETVKSPEFEQESFVERSLVTRRSETPAAVPLPILMPRQSVLPEPRQTVPENPLTKKVPESRRESAPPTPTLRQSAPQKARRIFPPKEGSKPSIERKAAVQPEIVPRAVSTLPGDKPSNSARRKSDMIKSPLLDVIASRPLEHQASHEVGPREETGRSQPAVALEAVVVAEPRERELAARSDLQAVVPTIRPLPPVTPLQPVAATAPPTINVTIGRVEIRAVSPPAQQRVKPKAPTVLSLEDYLRQRAKGVSR